MMWAYLYNFKRRGGKFIYMSKTFALSKARVKKNIITVYKLLSRRQAVELKKKKKKDVCSSFALAVSASRTLPHTRTDQHGFTELPEQILSTEDYQRLIPSVWPTQWPTATAVFTVLNTPTNNTLPSVWGKCTSVARLMSKRLQSTSTFSNVVRIKKKQNRDSSARKMGWLHFVHSPRPHNKNKHVCEGGKNELDLSFSIQTKKNLNCFFYFFFFFEDMVRQRSVMISGLL